MSDFTFFDISVPIPIWILTLTLSASAGGSAGILVQAGEQSTFTGNVLAASATALATVVGSFSAAIGIGIAIAELEAGIEGDITIASIGLPLTAQAGFVYAQFDSGTGDLVNPKASTYACEPKLNYDLHAELDYTFLAGSVSVFIKGCIVFCATLFKAKLFSWNGIHGKDVLFDKHDSVAAGRAYSDLPQYGYPLPKIDGKTAAFSADDASGRPAACTSMAKLIGAKVDQ